MARTVTTTRVPYLDQERTHLRTRTEPILGSRRPSLSSSRRPSVGDSSGRPVHIHHPPAFFAASSQAAPSTRPTSARSKSYNDSALSEGLTPTLFTEFPGSHTTSALRSPDSDLSTLTPASASPSRPRTSSSSTESRSRRPPASHSSYGIETSSGPPPSFSTQRTFSQDRLWKPPAPESLDASHTLKNNICADNYSNLQDTLGFVSPIVDTAISADQSETTNAPSPDERTSREEKDIAQAARDLEMDAEDKDRTVKEFDFGSLEEEARASSGEDRKSDDIFLKIARSDPNQPDTTSQFEKQRLQSSLPASMPSVSRYHERATDDPISPTQSMFPPKDLMPPIHTDPPAFSSKRSSLLHKYSAASAHPLDEASRPRSSNLPKSTSRSTVGRDSREIPLSYTQGTGRRLSNADRTYRPSHASNLRNTRATSTTETSERARTADSDRPRVEGTESTISTTAPSTVWDELDDLKSRIKKLELTGKLPSSSAAAMSNASAERPRTATTTVTTMSSSPKHLMKKNSSPVETSTGGVPSSVHPLLHEALAKARPVISSDIYQKLEATAADALQLASMLGGPTNSASGTSTVTGNSSVERQLRRRGDSMCRGLTELTIALASEAPQQQPVAQVRRPVSSHDRSLNEEPGQTISRVQSRLENRRRSLMAGGGFAEGPRLTSPETTINSPTARPSSSGRLNRTSLLRSRRGDGVFDGQDEEERSPSIRPSSRAMTDLTGPHLVPRSSPRDRNFSREYTSQHPLPPRDEPDNSTRSFNGFPSRTFSTTVNSSIHNRRDYVHPGSAAPSNIAQSPITPTFQPKTALRRYGGSSVERASTVESLDSTPESGGARLTRSGQRRSLGLGSRLSVLSSSVGSRLRAAKTEKPERNQSEEPPLGDGEITALPQRQY